MEQPPDDEIVALVRRGDEGASRVLVERLYPTIAGIIRKHLPRREEEEDLIQEVFMKLFAKMDSYAGKQPIAHWASRIAVTLNVGERSASLRVADDGVGFDTGEASRGLGLSSMRERVALVQGQLRLHSRPGEGTEVVARVPIRGAAGNGRGVPGRGVERA